MVYKEEVNGNEQLIVIFSMLNKWKRGEKINKN